MYVKICGNTTLADARASALAGADMLGFILYDRSPRYVSAKATAEIIVALRDELGEGAPTMVGVFVDESPDIVRDLLDRGGLDRAQLHGSEPPAEVRILQPRAFKAIRPQSRGDAEAVVATYANVIEASSDGPDFLVDAYHPWVMGGTGQAGDWAIGQVLARRFRIMLAGGLTPESVGAAIARVQPWGVDVASGVERAPGQKDHDRLRAFIQAAKRAPVEEGELRG